MQQWLSQHEYQGKTLWKRFTDWVTESLLGFKRGTCPQLAGRRADRERRPTEGNGARRP
jgi:hypothetical protein